MNKTNQIMNQKKFQKVCYNPFLARKINFLYFFCTFGFIVLPFFFFSKKSMANVDNFSFNEIPSRDRSFSRDPVSSSTPVNNGSLSRRPHSQSVVITNNNSVALADAVLERMINSGETNPDQIIIVPTSTQDLLARRSPNKNVVNNSSGAFSNASFDSVGSNNSNPSVGGRQRGASMNLQVPSIPPQQRPRSVSTINNNMNTVKNIINAAASSSSTSAALSQQQPQQRLRSTSNNLAGSAPNPVFSVEAYAAIHAAEVEQNVLGATPEWLSSIRQRQRTDHDSLLAICPPKNSKKVRDLVLRQLERKNPELLVDEEARKNEVMGIQKAFQDGSKTRAGYWCNIGKAKSFEVFPHKYYGKRGMLMNDDMTIVEDVKPNKKRGASSLSRGASPFPFQIQNEDNYYFYEHSVGHHHHQSHQNNTRFDQEENNDDRDFGNVTENHDSRLDFYNRQRSNSRTRKIRSRTEERMRRRDRLERMKVVRENGKRLDQIRLYPQQFSEVESAMNSNDDVSATHLLDNFFSHQPTTNKTKNDFETRLEQVAGKRRKYQGILTSNLIFSHHDNNNQNITTVDADGNTSAVPTTKKSASPKIICGGRKNREESSFEASVFKVLTQVETDSESDSSFGEELLNNDEDDDQLAVRDGGNEFRKNTLDDFFTSAAEKRQEKEMMKLILTQIDDVDDDAESNNDDEIKSSPTSTKTRSNNKKTLDQENELLILMDEQRKRQPRNLHAATSGRNVVAASLRPMNEVDIAKAIGDHRRGVNQQTKGISFSDEKNNKIVHPAVEVDLVGDLLTQWNQFHPEDRNVAEAALPLNPKLMELIFAAPNAAEARKRVLLEKEKAVTSSL